MLPPLRQGLRIAELFRRAALAMHHEPSEILAGKEGGKRRRGPHEHAHYLPEARGQEEESPARRRITHVMVYAPAGFTPSEVRALSRISYLPWHERKGVDLRLDVRRISKRPPETERDALDLDVVLGKLGQCSDFILASPLFGSSRSWRSVTPFVLPRHVKRDRDRPEDQLLRELEYRGFPRPVELLPVPLEWREFLRRRLQDHDTTPATGFEFSFSEPQSGPILLGYGSHFGLGQFVPVGI